MVTLYKVHHRHLRGLPHLQILPSVLTNCLICSFQPSSRWLPPLHYPVLSILVTRYCHGGLPDVWLYVLSQKTCSFSPLLSWWSSDPLSKHWIMAMILPAPVFQHMVHSSTSPCSCSCLLHCALSPSSLSHRPSWPLRPPVPLSSSSAAFCSFSCRAGYILTVS